MPDVVNGRSCNVRRDLALVALPDRSLHIERGCCAGHATRLRETEEPVHRWLAHPRRATDGHSIAVELAPSISGITQICTRKVSEVSYRSVGRLILYTVGAGRGSSTRSEFYLSDTAIYLNDTASYCIERTDQVPLLARALLKSSRSREGPYSPVDTGRAGGLRCSRGWAVRRLGLRLSARSQSPR
jgi:hypothetical protein